MGKKLPIFYSALLLTGVNLLLRFVSTSFQVYMSGQIGASGIGLLQLVLSVGALATTAGMGGIRTATMYLSAETIGQRKTSNIPWVLSGCVIYSIILSSIIACTLFYLAPFIAEKWIGNFASIYALRLIATFLPINCLCGVMIGYFTGANKIGTLAIVEIAEQMISMPVTIILLKFWVKNNADKACEAVILGSGIGACFMTVTLVLLIGWNRLSTSKKVSTKSRLWETAVPLAIADNVKAGINTTENLMVPKRLALYPGSTAPLAAFGMICGMVFPVLMFPAAILFGLAELLIPEIARCNAVGSHIRIRYLTEKSIKIAMLYGILWGGLLFLGAGDLCNRLYHTQETGKYLQWFAILTPMLYSDAIVDAITKGLGKQKICVTFNIITSILDVILLYILLPNYGITGYFISFFISHFINLILSTGLLIKHMGKMNSIENVVLGLLSGLAAVVISMQCGKNGWIIYIMLLFIFLWAFKVVKTDDFKWFMAIIWKENQTGKIMPQ